MANYAILVHSLKSDSKYLGFTTLAELSYNHEMASKAGDAEFVNMSGPLVNGLNVQGGNVVLFLGASATGVEVTGGNVNVDDAAKLNDVEINGGTVTVSDTADISNTEIISGLLTVPIMNNYIIKSTPTEIKTPQTGCFIQIPKTALVSYVLGQIFSANNSFYVVHLL